MISKNLSSPNDEFYQQDLVVRVPYVNIDKTIGRRQRSNPQGRLLMLILPLISALAIILFYLGNGILILNNFNFLLICFAGLIGFILAHIIDSVISN
jgi:hypothetical protein